MEDHVKNLNEIKMDSISCSILIYQDSNFTVEVIKLY